jgi:5-methyltetrahydropteroyltriglutamate--homocysteine methyltransferase
VLTSDERVLTTHAGSLPRTKELVALHARRARGEAVDEDEFAAAIGESTRDVVARQIECGIDIGSDGEQARESFFSYVQHRMTGFGGVGSRPIMADIVRFPDWVELRAPDLAREQVSLWALPACVGEVSSTGTSEVEAECAAYRRALDQTGNGFVESFMTAASPGIVALAMEDKHYRDRDEYVAAVAEALRVEYEYIVSQGLVLQIDGPDLAMERHATFADRPIEEFRAFVDHVVDQINRALVNIPRDRVRLHVCWGNYDGPHVFDVALDDILPNLCRAQVGALVLSMANPRHAHEYRCFESQALPEGLNLIAGVIDTTTNYVEHPQVVAERIERIVAAVGDPTRVIAGTDCGFDTAAGFRRIAHDVCWEKFRALRAGADLATSRLFGA